MSAAWLAERPLELPEVCRRMRAAVEEREAAFKMSTLPAETYPLTLPLRPFNTGDHALAEFAGNLRMRVQNLLFNSYDPRNFGSWAGGKAAISDRAGVESLLNSWSLSVADWYCYRPYALRSMKFFQLCAALLDRYALYPAPPSCSSGLQQNGNVFGWDCRLKLTDLLTGSRKEKLYQPDGMLKITLDDGTVKYQSFNLPAQWVRELFSGSASDVRFYYDASCAAAPRDLRRSDAVELTGTFQLRLPVTWKRLVNGSAAETFSDVALCTISPGGESDRLAVPDICRQWIAETLDGSGDENISKLSVSLDLNTSAAELFLETANYPPLEYRYLSL